MRICVLFWAFLLVIPARAAPCMAQSGEQTTALVELYTSEGCSDCSPAHRWLSSLGKRGYPPESVVPLALHLNYRHYTGWKDPDARRDFSQRQRKLTQQQRMALVYTPQVLLQGRDFRGWGTSAFDDAVARINARPAKARLHLEIASVEPEAMAVGAVAELLDAGDRSQAMLYLAAYEDRLETLVLEWQGPFAFAQPTLTEQRWLPLLPKADPAKSGVVGFIQDRRTGEVLQALMLPACLETFGYIRAK
jgi:hypothetical protein